MAPSASASSAWMLSFSPSMKYVFDPLCTKRSLSMPELTLFAAA